MTRPKDGPKGWVLRRVFDCDKGPVARWWLGGEAAFGENLGYGEPEDAAQFRTKLEAESEYRAVFGTLEKNECAQRVAEAFAEVSLGDLPPGRGMKRGSTDTGGKTLNETRGPRLPLSAAERST